MNEPDPVETSEPTAAPQASAMDAAGDVPPEPLTDPPLMHVHSPGAWHEPAALVANRAGLTELRDAISAALDGDGMSFAELCVADGEGYDLVVLLDERPWQEWDNQLPYTDEIAADTNRPHPLERDDVGEGLLAVHRQRSNT